MTTKTKRPTDVIRAQRADIDATLAEFQQRKDALRYARHLSDEGKHNELRAVTAQYLANLTSDATASWKLAQAALSTARADYRAAVQKHNERLDPARLSWLARETASRLAAAPLTSDRVGAFDPITWLGAQRDRLAEAGDVVAMRALRVVARENLGNALDSQSAGRLAVLLQHDEDAEAADVLAAQREVQAAEAAADDLRRRILEHRLTLDPSAGAGLAGPDGFAREVFGADAVPPGAVMSS